MDVKPDIGVYVVFDYITILVPGRKRPMYRKSFLFADFWKCAIYRG